MDRDLAPSTDPTEEAQSALSLRRMEDPIEEHVMPPPRTRPSKPKAVERRPSRRVLEEEEYVAALSRIIERDFFPALAELRREEDGPGAEALPGVGGSLDEFLAEHTSEDNASFEEVHRRDLEERRRRLHWAYAAGDGRQEGMLALYHLGDRVLSVEDRQRMDRLLAEGADSADQRPNGANPWRFRVRNQLMFPPELEDSKDVCLMLQDAAPGARALPAAPQLLLSDSSSRTGPPSRSDKAIAHRNTRLPLVAQRPEASPLERPHSPSEYSQAGSLDVPAPSPHRHSGERSHRPVPMTPLIEPGALASPLITWGEVAATPLALSAEGAQRRDPPGSFERLHGVPSFTIGGPSAREELARKLDSVGKTAGVKRPRTPGSRALTPAAISLANRVRASTGPPTPFGEDSTLRASYASSTKKTLRP